MRPQAGKLWEQMALRDCVFIPETKGTREVRANLLTAGPVLGQRKSL